MQAKLAIDTNAEVAHQQILVLQNEPASPPPSEPLRSKAWSSLRTAMSPWRGTERFREQEGVCADCHQRTRHR
ncbi:hypothetical protein I551_8717 [Mycobacterium ulcerans str. Harvey]|uniref:Uncharacterized protein n=1 Tax=Mycobacterium ulcerans str. Harvey TaxID=1299332 RepID=A0ABN0RAX8_MYCUL|nr:hypothetical protein I551_8717 [Mycobacterium ulcerans str. Harvey]